MYLSFSAEKTHNASTDRVNCTCLSWATVLPSIPDELRIPQSQYTDDNIESYIRKKYSNPDPANITNVFLMEYNPAIAPIPTAMKEYLPNDAVYVLSLRVTPHNFCFGIWLTQSLSDDIKQTMHLHWDRVHGEIK